MREMIEYLSKIEWLDLTQSSIESAKLVLIDSLGAQIFGNRTKEVIDFARMCAEKSPGSYQVVGTGIHTELLNAAWLNGSGAVATEMDEGNQWSKGHPAAHIVPTLLTAVQGPHSLSGKQLLLALVKGYEVCSRFGRATTLLPAAHAHGTWGVAGAAASVFYLEDTSVDEVLEGLALSASFGLPTMWSAALEGALVRNSYMAHAIEMGIRIVDLVRMGYKAPNGNIQYVLGSVLGTNFDENALTVDLGNPWDIERNYFKPYAFCRYAHGPIDAFSDILEQHALQRDDIDTIDVETYSRAATLRSNDPQNVLSAKFSIPYALAVRFFTGSANHNSFADELLWNEVIRDFASKVNVTVNPELEKDYPTIMPAVVRVRTQSGVTFESRCDIARGGPTCALSQTDIEEKFRSLTDSVLSTERQDEILQSIWALDSSSDVRQLVELCTPCF